MGLHRLHGSMNAHLADEIFLLHDNGAHVPSGGAICLQDAAPPCPSHYERDDQHYYRDDSRFPILSFRRQGGVGKRRENGHGSPARDRSGRDLGGAAGAKEKNG